MSTIDPNNPFAALGLTSAGTQPADDNEIGADDFLELMIAQMQNQDPTSPMDSEAFLGQIAEFSSVTGLQELKESFDSLAVSLTSNQALQAAALIDKTVQVESEIGYLPENGTLSGQVVTFGPTDAVRVGIYDASGAIVRELSVPTSGEGALRFEWDGLSANGDPMPPGQYEMRVFASSGGRAVDGGVVVNAAVESVVMGRPGEPPQLVLQGLGAVRFDQVLAISQTGSGQQQNG